MAGLSRGRRGAPSDWLIVAGGVALAVSLFLTWSHQLPPATRLALRGSPLVRGVAESPTAWQVYSAGEVVLAALAVGLVAVAVAGRRRSRAAMVVACAAAVAFVGHALAAPPSSGVEAVLDPLSPAVPAVHVTAGAGETVALAGLGLALAGLLLSLALDR